jgi:hypothetical protein
MKQITTLPKSGSLKKRVSAIPAAPPVEIQIWPIDKLVAYARNPRKNDAAVDRMCASIREFGFKIPCLVRSGGEVIDGHLRLKAARKLGVKDIPVILCDEPEDIHLLVRHFAMDYAERTRLGLKRTTLISMMRRLGINPGRSLAAPARSVASVA